MSTAPRLIDFGFSKIWHPNTTMAVSCGTLAYVAPEVLDKSYTSQCDMWRLGVVAFGLLFGYMPFSGAAIRLSCLMCKWYSTGSNNMYIIYIMLLRMS